MAEATIVPIQDLNRGFRTWHMKEIYQGASSGKYIPNVDDMVLDWDMGYFRVIAVNATTGLSKLEEWTGPKKVESIPDAGILLGVDIGAQGESFKAFLDTSVTPHTLSCDGRLHVHGSNYTSIKIFEGSDISDTGKVISAMYDSGNTFLGENIPLELVKYSETTIDGAAVVNNAIKSPQTGYTLKQLPDGTPVIAVVYDDLGNAKSYSTLLIKNTGFIRTTAANKKYISSIHLESPLMDSADERVLKFPINMTVGEVPATGVVTYSDGTTLKLPANGGRFSLYGLDHFIASIVGQKLPLVLTYRLAADEVSYNVGVGGGADHISEDYWGTTTEFEKSYSLKLFCYPEWVNPVTGYKLKFYLGNLNRSEIYDVTSLVTPTSVSDVFSPLIFGTKQKLSYSINMNDVNPAYSRYTFVQTVEVTLMAPGTVQGTKWLVNFTPNQKSPYGNNIVAKVSTVNADLWSVDISNGYNSMEEWVRNIYYGIEPLYNVNNEVNAPAPTHLLLKTRLRSYEVPVIDWNKDIEFINDLLDGENLIIEFIHRVYENDIKLGVAAMPIRIL